MAYEFILYEKTSKVARITLNRPEPFGPKSRAR